MRRCGKKAGRISRRAVRNRDLLAACLLFALAATASAGEWVILRDGRVGRVVDEEKADFGAGAEAYAAAAVVARLDDADIRKRVDRVVAMRPGPQAWQAVMQLQPLGRAAVPRLLDYLRGEDMQKRANALVVLQFVWSDEAVVAVSDIAHSPGAGTLRALAISVLSMHATPTQVEAQLADLVDAHDGKVAAAALQALERVSPDVQRMLRALTSRTLKYKACDYLPRYYHPLLTPPTLALLKKRRKEVVLPAMTALIHQNADSAEARAAVTDLLDHGSAAVVDRAAEYLSWHGTPAEIDALDAAFEDVRDGYAAASILAAKEAIGRRAKLQRFMTKNDPEESNPYSEILWTAAGGGTDVRARVLTLLRNAEEYEPVLQYKKRGANDGRGFGPRCFARLALQGWLFAIPGLEKYWEAPERPAPEEDGEAEVAEKLNPPVRAFFDPKRKSFGEFINIPGTPFSGQYHVGDDMARKDDHATVVSIGAGVVRAAGMAPSFGGLVIVEHVDAEGERFCSLYGHLSPYIHVRAGQRLKKGQKLGSVGRAYTCENGGYSAHLHFGIHTGPFGTGQWITGYMRPEQFRSGNHGWVDPQKFIKPRM